MTDITLRKMINVTLRYMVDIILRVRIYEILWAILNVTLLAKIYVTP